MSAFVETGLIVMAAFIAGFVKALIGMFWTGFLPGLECIEGIRGLLHAVLVVVAGFE